MTPRSFYDSDGPKTDMEPQATPLTNTPPPPTRRYPSKLLPVQQYNIGYIVAKGKKAITSSRTRPNRRCRTCRARAYQPSTPLSATTKMRPSSPVFTVKPYYSTYILYTGCKKIFGLYPQLAQTGWQITIFAATNPQFFYVFFRFFFASQQ